jgi:16S rRNA (guanine966-N2)-methyltransferase
MSTQSNIRIIGGKWRSRKVSFETKDTLRPTPDRVRETLFNWLSPHVAGADCLDLYAGSGVLGLEALSRGAKSAIAVEADRANAKCIEQNQKILQTDALTVLNKNVLDWLTREYKTFDIVFADPPYKDNLLQQTLQLLEQHNWLKVNSLIYFEQDQPLDPKMLPATWSIWRESKAGRVYYYLAIKEH